MAPVAAKPGGARVTRNVVDTHGRRRSIRKMNTAPSPMNVPESKLIRRFRWSCSLLATGLAVALCTGCVTNGRRVLLREYGPSIPVVADGALKGSTVYLKGFTCAQDLIALELQTKPEEPASFKYLELTREQDKTWEKEMKALQKETREESWKKIGNMRNGFGMVMSHVWALNDPATWMAEGIKFDLEAQGAKVVDATQAGDADISVSGTIQLCREDMYFTVNASLAVDLDVQPRKGQARRRQIHTRGATAAMLASEGEYFHALRDARQKFSILAIHEISQAVKPDPVKQSSAK